LEEEGVGDSEVSIEPQCFPAGTPVATSHGLKSIEQIRKGDEVWSLDLKTGIKHTEKIENTYELKRAELIEIGIDGALLEVTPEHPFWVQERGWVPASCLKVGDPLLSSSGLTVLIESIETKAGARTVFNFSVPPFHNYFVGSDEVLVHNRNAVRSAFGSVRRTFWKREYARVIQQNSGQIRYSARNLIRLKKGRAPQMLVRVVENKTGMERTKLVSLDIHHRVLPVRSGSPKANEMWNLEKAAPWSHQSLDPNRFTGYKLLQIIKGPNSL
jgi:hypothetical protein